MRTLFLTLCLLVTATYGVIGVPVQWAIASGGNGHWYEPVLQDGSWVTWAAARDAARLRGGYLATISSPAENALVYSLVSSDDFWRLKGVQYNGPWLGGYQDRADPAFSEPSGGWKWVTSEAWEYSNWGSGQPDNYLGGPQDYLHFWHAIGTARAPFWDDAAADDILNSYIVEWNSNPVPEPTSLLALLCGLGGAGSAVVRTRRRRDSEPLRVLRH
ncbi:MAG: PEP-CTERM sorting domain-containing protein [Armatimonadetes bacterium]|nr:PEP-CTERM sorting domain-containing protein [Armatimonadota bacterium]